MSPWHCWTVTMCHTLGQVCTSAGKDGHYIPDRTSMWNTALGYSGFFFSPNTAMKSRISTNAGRTLQKAKITQYVQHSHLWKTKKDRETDALQWTANERRPWVQLNIDTPEKKPASSIANRPMVTDNATTNLVSSLSYWSCVKSKGRQASTLFSRDQKMVMTMTRWAVRVRNRAGTRLLTADIAPAKMCLYGYYGTLIVLT